MVRLHQSYIGNTSAKLASTKSCIYCTVAALPLLGCRTGDCIICCSAFGLSGGVTLQHNSSIWSWASRQADCIPWFPSFRSFSTVRSQVLVDGRYHASTLQECSIAACVWPLLCPNFPSSEQYAQRVLRRLCRNVLLSAWSTVLFRMKVFVRLSFQEMSRIFL